MNNYEIVLYINLLQDCIICRATPPKVAMNCQKRLLKELLALSTEPSQTIKLQPLDPGSMLVWTAILPGPKDTPYAGGWFKLLINIPQGYPIEPPNIKFVTKICHPNIHFKTGEICIDLLAARWTPAYTLLTACEAIGMLLVYPEPDSPLNCDAANILRAGDIRGFDSLVQMYIEMYAISET